MVKINVPGIGEITADNAASEDTLQQLVRAVERTNQIASQKSAGQTPGQRDAEKALNQQTKSIGNNTKTRDTYNRKLQDTTDAQREYTETLDESMSSLEIGMRNATASVVSGLGDLGLSALSLSAQLMTNYEDMARNPISAAQSVMHTAIDVAGSAIKAAADLATGIAVSATAWVPFAGASLQKGFETANKAAQAAVDAAASTLHIVNDVFAKELANSSNALATFTASGASFADGLTGLRQAAVSANLPIEIFANAVSKSSENLRLAGFSQGEGAQMLAKVMDQTSKITNNAGLSLRDQMLGLGVSYEEQGEIIAQLMATQRLSGVQERMDAAELAKITRDYAEDLKVLRDITGQDAKNAMDAARAKALEADIIAQLKTPDEIAKFQRALAATPEPLKKGFLEFVSTGGKAISDGATNIMMAQVPALRDHLNKVFADIKDPSVPVNSMMDVTLSGFSEVGKQAKELGSTLASAVRLGNIGGDVAGAVAAMNETIRLSMVTPEEIAKSREAATEQATVTDKQSANLVKMTAITNDHAVKMQALVTANMESYTNYAKTTLDITTSAIQDGIRLLGKDLKEIAREAFELARPSNANMQTAADQTKYEQEVKQVETALSGLATKLAEAEKKLDATGYDWWNPFQTMTDEMKTAKDNIIALENERNNLKENRQILEQDQSLATGSYGQGMASGGIASGPITGFTELLHGIEAVVPLPDGKSIPVKMTMPDIGASLIQDLRGQLTGQSNELMSQIVQAMQQVGLDNKLLSSKLSTVQTRMTDMLTPPDIQITSAGIDAPNAAPEFSADELAKLMLVGNRDLLNSLIQDVKTNISSPATTVDQQSINAQTTMLRLIEQLVAQQDTVPSWDSTLSKISDSVKSGMEIVTGNSMFQINTNDIIPDANATAQNNEENTDRMINKLSSTLENVLKTQSTAFGESIQPLQFDLTNQMTNLSGSSKESTQRLTETLSKLTEQNSELLQLMSDSVNYQRRIVDNTG